MLGQWQKEAPARRKDNLQIRQSQLLNAALRFGSGLPIVSKTDHESARLLRRPRFAAQVAGVTSGDLLIDLALWRHQEDDQRDPGMLVVRHAMPLSPRC